MISVGEILKTERKRKGFLLKQIEKDIKIRERFLEAVEDNNWSLFSSKIYIIGIIKNYANYLGLNSQKLIAVFRRDYEKKDDIQFKQKISLSQVIPQTRKIIFLVGIIAFLLFVGYFSYQLKQFLSPPTVTVISPKDIKFRSVENIKIVGKTEKEASVIIYGEKVYPNKEGIFEYVFPLRQGKNELIIEVVGANGKKASFKKEYIKE